MCCVRSAASEKLCMRRQIVVRSNACTSARRPVKEDDVHDGSGLEPSHSLSEIGAS